MLFSTSTLLPIFLAVQSALCHDRPHHTSQWDLRNFASLVAFGDSYTDDNRLNYFLTHNGSAPPPGWINPANYHSADGGRPWVQYVSQYTNADLYNYAVAGAVCSNDITPRYLSYIHQDFPAVKQYELPAFAADSAVIEPSGSKFLAAPQDETVYTLWIGTNDLGVNALLTDSQVPGTTIVNYTNCVFDSLEQLYAEGGRYFVLLNVAPLNLAPLYALPGAGGVGPNQYWMDKPSNLTAISERMLESVVTVNAIYQYQLPYEIFAANKFPEARFALMNVHGVFTSIYNNPSAFLNGTAPANVTGFIHHCDIHTGTCVDEPSPDSLMWYDELHLSEQTARVVAREFVKVVKGTSEYATYWSARKSKGGTRDY